MIKPNTLSMCLAAFCIFAIAIVAPADTTWYDSEGFEGPLFHLGRLAGDDMYSGQDGWLITDPDYEVDLDGIVVQDSFVFQGTQTILFDAAMQTDIEYAHLRTNVMAYPPQAEPVIDVILDIYIQDSPSRSEVWGLDVQSGVTSRLLKWLVWDDNRLTILVNDEWIDTDFEFQRDIWYNVRTSINFQTWTVDLFINGNYVLSTSVIDQWYDQLAFAAIYLGNPGNDRLYFDNFRIIGYGATDIADRDSQTLPANFALLQNYPNPFNASTTIVYRLSEPSEITLEIFDILGRTIETISESYKPAGEYRLIWEAGNRPSGVYYYRLKADDYTLTKNMLLLK